MKLPVYLTEKGDRLFKSTLTMDNGTVFTGYGRSKKDAEQDAAAKVDMFPERVFEKAVADCMRLIVELRLQTKSPVDIQTHPCMPYRKTIIGFALKRLSAPPEQKNHHVCCCSKCPSKAL